jgi:hypothetical protein
MPGISCLLASLHRCLGQREATGVNLCWVQVGITEEVRGEPEMNIRRKIHLSGAGFFTNTKNDGQSAGYSADPLTCSQHWSRSKR